MIRLVLISWMLLLWWLPPETHGYSLAVAAWIAVLAAWLLPISSTVATGLGIVLAAGWVWQLGAANVPLALPPLATMSVASVLFAIATWGRGAPKIESLLVGIRIGVSGVSIWAIYQKVFGLNALAAQVAAMDLLPSQARILERIEEGRAFAGFVTPAALGGFLALWIPLLLWDAWRHRTAPATAVWKGGLLALVLAAFVSAASVTATFALLGCVGLLMLRQAMRDRRALAAVGLLALLLVVMIGIRGRDVLDPNAKRGPIGLRFGNFRAAAELIVDRPIVGYGAGGFAEYYPTVRRQGDNETRHVHNLPLEWMVEWGLPVGGLASVGFVGLLLLPLWLRRPNSPRANDAAGEMHLALAVGCASFALQNLLDFTSMLPSLLWTASWCTGMVWRQRLASPLEPLSDRSTEGHFGDSQAVSGELVGASRFGSFSPARLALMIGICLPAWVLCGTGIAKESLRTAQSQLAVGALDAARSSAAAARAYAPWLPESRFVRAECTVAEGPSASVAQLTEALEDVNGGIRIAPQRPRGYRLRANLRARSGDLPGASADLDSAVQRYPFDKSIAAEREAVDQRLESWGL